MRLTIAMTAKIGSSAREKRLPNKWIKLTAGPFSMGIRPSPGGLLTLMRRPPRTRRCPLQLIHSLEGTTDCVGGEGNDALQAQW
jgi:hypothetical protein